MMRYVNESERGGEREREKKNKHSHIYFWWEILLLTQKDLAISLNVLAVATGVC